MYDWRVDVRARVANAGLRPEEEAEIVEEVAQHLEAQFAELAPKVGEAEARAQLVAQLKDERFDEAARSGRRRNPPRAIHAYHSGSLRRDLRYGLRSLRRSPGTVAAGVAALALGIGLSTVMFSIIYGLLLKGLPFENPERIAMIYRADPTGRGQEALVPYADFVRYQADQRSFAIVAAYLGSTANVTGGDRAERIRVASMTAGVFEVAGVRPIIGRTFSLQDNAPGAAPTAMLGHAMWRDRFGGDSSVLNKTLRVNGQPYAIIGVMPEGYEFPRGFQGPWLPLQLEAAGLHPGQGSQLTLLARLRPGVSYANANADLLAVSRRLVSSEPADSVALRTMAQPFIRATMPARVYSLLYGMLTAVFLVLLIACANVANLLLGRASNRTREIGIRVALGASRTAVIRQALIESAVIALTAAAVGTLLAQAGIIAFNRALVTFADDQPFWMDIRLHIPVLAFVLALAIVASIASGLLPAIHSARVDISTILKDESHAASSFRIGRLSRAIVVGELALSTMMLLAAGFMTKSIVQLRRLDPRFTSEAVVTARTSLTTTDTLRQRQFFETVERDLTAQSGLDGVYLGSDLPGAGWRGERIAIEGHSYVRERDYPFAQSLAVSPGFFHAFNVPVLRGRAILSSDRSEWQRVAVVSEAFARRNFPGADPLGRRIRIVADSNTTEWLTIVGVIPSLYALGRVSADGDHFPPEVLTSFWQQHRLTSASIALRGPATVANAVTVRKVISALDPDLPVYATASMYDVLNKPVWPVRVFGTLFVIFGVVALLLSAIGLYAVMAFSVDRRAREMGIRMALGATAGGVIRMVCRQGTKQIVVGMSIGLLMGAVFVRALGLLLFEVRPNDPAVFGVVASVLGLAALLACLIPAVRATRVDPLVALRSE
ncbi:MAG TPA: ABC transporter permease [Gemmatimonadaceae bacterium]|nr:ABC transporter permease [Gemmatimonadaceae bacterium]